MWAVAAYLWPTTLVHFETLVMKMLREMTEYCCKIKAEVEHIQSEIKKNIQGTNSERSRLGLKSTIWSRGKK